MKYSNVIPVYNSEKSLPELCERIKNVYETTVNADYEIILVNDCSKDNSWKVLKELHEKYDKVKAINLSKNSGQHSATQCGFKYCTGDYVVILDDDLQNPPEEIPKLINHILENEDIDVVIGTYISKQHSIVRNIGTKLMKVFSSIMFKTDGKLKFTTFRIVRGSIAKEISGIRIARPGIGSMIRATTSRISSVMVEHKERKFGRSGYSFNRLVKRFFNNIFDNSILPLKFISFLGVFFAFLGLGYAGYLVVRYFLHGSSIKGWTSLMVMVTFFSGTILFTLGIVGEYLLRILIETRKLPTHLEREKLL